MNSIGEHSKLSHKQVEYEHPAKYENKRCALCEHYEAPHCAIVRDPIRPGDWCNRFERGRVHG